MFPPWSFCLAQHIDQRTKDVVTGFNKNILMTIDVPAIVNCVCICYFYEEKLQKVNVQQKENYGEHSYTKTDETCYVLNQQNKYNYITEACGLYEIDCDRIKNHTVEWKFRLNTSVAIIGLVSTRIQTRDIYHNNPSHQYFVYKSSNGVTVNGAGTPNTSVCDPEDRIVYKNDIIRMLFETNKKILKYYRNESNKPFMEMHMCTKYDCKFSLWVEVHISGSIELLSFRVTPSNAK
eukprot:14865_1